MVCAQVIKNETKWKWKHPHVSIIRGMKSSHGVCSMYDHVFTWASIIVTCAIVVDVCYTISVRVGSTMIMSIKVRKLFLMRRISIRCWVWQGKRWEISFWTCAPFSKIIVAIVSRSVSWVVVCSLPQEHRNEWVRRSSMVWSHWHRKKGATIVCDKPKWVWGVVRKWIKDKWNASVVGRANKPNAHPWTHTWTKMCAHNIWKNVY